MLWARVAGLCSHPECRIGLHEHRAERDDAILVSENYDMVAESDGGPRADPSVPKQRRHRYVDLVLLCGSHHMGTDAQVGQCALDRLQKMRTNHERQVQEQHGLDAAKQRDDEYYAGVVEKWEKLVDLEKWANWSSWVLGGRWPRIEAYINENIRQLSSWLLTPAWPGRYPALESAFKNFRLVATDFYDCFNKHAEKPEYGLLETRLFYQINGQDGELDDKLLSCFDHHVDLVQDLMLELARAANLICDRVREYLMPSYRVCEGPLLVIDRDPVVDLKIVEFLVQYSPRDLANQYPYPGLIKFLDARAERDRHFGKRPAPSSVSPDGLRPTRSTRRRRLVADGKQISLFDEDGLLQCVGTVAGDSP